MPITQAIIAARPRPSDNALQAAKKNYGERLSNEVALVIASELRAMGAAESQPDPTIGGRERRFAGGIGAKKVDVSFATEEAGLILAVTIKTINYADQQTGNYQKNLTNRRNDMLAESTTLHQRFPYAVVGGLLLLHDGAANDATNRRSSTFATAHDLWKGVNGRTSRSNAVEMLEAMAIALYDDGPPHYGLYLAGDPGNAVTLRDYLARLLEVVADRNPDHYRFAGGHLNKR